MITQYSTNGTISSEIQTLIASKISILDKYVLMRTGENEYSALIYSPLTKNCTEYIVRRSSQQGYTSTYIVEKYDNTDYRYNISNEYYVYSNEGYGRMLDLPVYDVVNSFGMCILTSFAILAVAFKGVLFRCLRK